VRCGHGAQLQPLRTLSCHGLLYRGWRHAVTIVNAAVPACFLGSRLLAPQIEVAA
jgi:hypothetical protein